MLQHVKAALQKWHGGRRRTTEEVNSACGGKGVVWKGGLGGGNEAGQDTHLPPRYNAPTPTSRSNACWADASRCVPTRRAGPMPAQRVGTPN